MHILMNEPGAPAEPAAHIVTFNNATEQWYFIRIVSAVSLVFMHPALLLIHVGNTFRWV